VKTHFDSKKKEKWEAGFGVKARSEPRNIVQVLEVIAAVKKMDEDFVAEQIFTNSFQLFNFSV
jgi:TatD DNase family protein